MWHEISISTLHCDRIMADIMNKGLNEFIRTNTIVGTRRFIYVNQNSALSDYKYFFYVFAFEMNDLGANRKNFADFELPVHEEIMLWFKFFPLKILLVKMSGGDVFC